MDYGAPHTSRKKRAFLPFSVLSDDYVHIKCETINAWCRWCMLLLNKYDFEKKINILEYAFGEGGGGHQKAYAVYAFINVDNCERPLMVLSYINETILIRTTCCRRAGALYKSSWSPLPEVNHIPCYYPALQMHARDNTHPVHACNAKSYVRSCTCSLISHKHIHPHDRTHTHTHARTHARTHTRTHARTHVRTYARTHTHRTHARTHRHTHARMLARLHVRAHAGTNSHNIMHARTRTRTYTHTYTYIHTHSYKLTQTKFYISHAE